MWLLVLLFGLFLPGFATADDRLPIRHPWAPSADEVLRGVSATEADCRTIPNAVWADAGHSGRECIRYWGAPDPTGRWERPVVFFHGDLLTGRDVNAEYLRVTELTLQQQAADWAQRLSTPYLFIGRPGTFGSSGEHSQRRRKAESEILSAALDALKQRLSISEFALTGVSGGGHVVAALLVTRTDIVCAVPASAVASPRARWIYNGWRQDSTGHGDSYEPLEHLTRRDVHPRLRLFVVGSPDDRNTPWISQQLLSGRARALGIRTHELVGRGSGPQSHGMANSGRQVAGWCATGLSDEQILERARQGLEG